MKNHNDSIPPQEGYYDDYYPDGETGEETMTPEDRERYYAERDAYYAQRDAYYARRDAYYARQEEEEAEEDYQPLPRRPRPEADPRDYQPEDAAPPRRRRRRRGSFLRNLLILLMAAALVLMLCGEMPVRPEDGRTRLPGRSTVLIAGTDEDGTRTDTILLLTLDQPRGTVSLLSIPRDTYAPGYAAWKINSAYGAAGGGERGMEELLRCVRGVLGFTPDRYVLVDMDVVADAVDLLGGADFNVPMDMSYLDRAENLVKQLTAGFQHLTGDQVLGLLRFRSGYATADIGRTEVQRDFVREALKQWFQPSRWKVIPQLWELFRSRMTSDLSFRELMWVARVLAKADRNNMASEVVPGWPDMVEGYSVYMVDETALKAMLPTYSPYENN